MANSQDINYALISALYANKKGGLYSDVYFPIIKYTIVQLFNKMVTSEKKAFYTAKDVHDFIEFKFNIQIPTIVITKSLEKIEQTNKNFVELSLMEHGNSFQINRVWDSGEFDELTERENEFSEGLKNIEADYKFFLEKNGTYDDGVTYLQFISDNTQEVLGYFQNSDTSVIDEKYTTIIFFLEYLHNTPSKKNEFYIADQLFWASIIAGYLKSEKPFVNAAEVGSVKEYYLDTSILLGILELSTSQKETYAKEVKEIIESSGGVMKAHPMTLEEIKNILNSVESSGLPDPGTDIAEAWENHHLTINRIAQIRFGLQGLLEEQGVQIFPLLGPEQCRNITASYKGKKVVFELACERSMKPKSYSQDYFREIHDLFMDDYIKERRKTKTIQEDVVFVTANHDLISFTRKLHPDVNYMMSTGRVILDLWMHSVKPVNISDCALTETMARCLDQHNLRVRNKIVEVSKFFNANKGNFDAQVYQDFIRKLYRRAKNVILTVETDPDNQDTLNALTAQRILDAMKADQEYVDKQVKETEADKSELEEKLSREIQEKENLTEKERAHEEKIVCLEKEKQQLSTQVEEVKKAMSDKDKAIEQESIGRKEAECKIALYQKRDNLNKEREYIEAELTPLTKKREGAFNNSTTKWLMGIGIFLIVVAVCVILFAICTSLHWLIAAGAVPSGIGIYLCTQSSFLKDREKERRETAYQAWEKKIENQKYSLLIKRRDELIIQITEIEKALR